MVSISSAWRKSAARATAVLGFFLFLTGYCWGQSGYEDVVYLKNGSIIHGMIIEQIPNQSLKIQTADRNLFVFKFEEIEKITKEAIPQDNPSKPQEDPHSELDRGRFTFVLEGNFGFANRLTNTGTRRLGLVSLGGTVAFDVNIKKKLSLGVGAGYDAIDIYSFIPIFLDIRYYFSNHRVTPYLSAGLGYSIGPSLFDRGGWYVNPNLGIRWNIAPRSALNFGLGGRLQTEIDRNQYYSFSMINLKVGAIF